ncbi:hypothetical protein AAFX91_12695, partial [Bradyrhizobium sp. 31Argb]|uniref:hypothetical protein n=1 Tax=Bradyrhizobium sp. 31Argb TaxID=3141247 RepID=UPI003747A878
APFRTTTRHVGLGLAACDCLTDQVLPDLAQAARPDRAAALDPRPWDGAMAIPGAARKRRLLMPMTRGLSSEHCNVCTTRRQHSAAI